MPATKQPSEETPVPESEPPPQDTSWLELEPIRGVEARTIEKSTIEKSQDDA